MHKETWSFIETEKDKLRDTATKMAYEATRESRLLGTKPCGVFFGPSATLLKDIKHYGLEKIYFFETLTDLTPEILATYLCPLISQRQPLLILFACTSTGAELGSRVAAKLKKGFISNCVEFELSGGILIARKPLYEGKSYGYFTFRGEPPYIATINEISQEAVKVENAKAPEIVREQYEEPSIKTRFIKSWRLALKELGITEAQV
ncbi:MAG: hypothetical protein SVW57_06670, partial [Thermodesulfobacteriota bacterium]|nr:hypothetical protein [Thermodesulfobacteriota bacterium]